jgi:peptide/nickel transport system permease protein
MSVPAFLAGILLILLFSVTLGWLPAGGYSPLLSGPWQWFRHLILPVLALAIVQSAVLSRYVRSAFVDVLADDHLRTARAIGWRLWPALIRHGLRNASISLVTVVGLQLSTMLVGAIVVEQVFVIPGLGSYLLDAVSLRDLVVVADVVMVLVALVLLINFLVDALVILIDPRLRVSSGERGEES